MKFHAIFILGLGLAMSSCSSSDQEPIDRHALLERNSPVVTAFDSLSSLTVGNGRFAFTVDATGLQTFPEAYSHGVPLGTMSDWGWHSFPNPEGYRFDETLVTCDFGRGHKEVYSSQVSRAQEAEAKAQGGAVYRDLLRKKAAINYVRQNPHRLHLGNIGLALPEGTGFEAFSDVEQRLDLESGIITSSYKLNGEPVKVTTSVNPNVSLVAVRIEAQQPKPVFVRMPYPTGGHSDDACLWIDDPKLHSTSCEQLIEGNNTHFRITHHFPAVEVSDEFGNKSLHDATYWVDIDLDSCQAIIEQVAPNCIKLTPSTGYFAFTAEWVGEGARTENEDGYDPSGNVAHTLQAAEQYWHDYWYKGGVIDFSHCKAPEAKELERRVVLSQYLLAVNCAGNTPPQETGLTYNSWFGKYHMEMIWWHQAQFALFGHPELLERSMQWYEKVEPVARHIAQRQGFQGVRWMKMTDPSGLEAPSSTGSFLIWQQPHYIYLAELVRRAYQQSGDADKAAEVEQKYYHLVQETAKFMFDFADYDTLPNRYILKGAIPAQETLKASTTINPPFELSQWHFALGVANQWRQRHEGMKNMEWDELRDKLSPLHFITDSVYSAKYGDLYTASEDSEDTFRDIRLTSDHMAVLGALGIFPKSPLVREDIMRNTLHWVWDNWNWGKTWGWDYPMTAMCAARVGEPDMAVKVLLGSQRTNTYLVSGHNYQDSRLRLYLPGNGGLLTAVAMMCAGWDNCQLGKNPGFPKDGNWDVRWEGIQPLP
ncbi:MAG: hypothetical protein IJP70_00020 [Bacteroidales bacterium]|nr:hypothetical protein [Bacteroidales bacterium]